MNPNSFELNLPTDAPLSPPPQSDPDALQRWQAERMADFYASPHYEEWLARTSEEMRMAEPFVMD